MKRIQMETKWIFFLIVGGFLILSIIGFLVRDYMSACVMALIAATTGLIFWAQGTFEGWDDK